MFMLISMYFRGKCDIFHRKFLSLGSVWLFNRRSPDKR